jgi:hypothetical protein
MPDRGYQHRKEWNAKNYKQLNVALPPNLAAAFKAACEVSGEPVRQALLRLIEDYAQAPQKAKKAAAAPPPDYSTLGKRRAAVAAMLEQLEAIREAQEEYRDSIPENLQGSRRYEDAETAAGALGEAAAALEEAFSGG